MSFKLPHHRSPPPHSVSLNPAAYTSYNRANSFNMSRHKLVKNLDLDDELDDFDGGEDYDDYGEEAEGEQYYRAVSV